MPLPNKRKANVKIDLQMGPLTSRSTDYSEAHINIDDLPAAAEQALDKPMGGVLHDRSSQMYESPHSHTIEDDQ